MIACFSSNNRWRQLLVVGVLTWFLGGMINIPLFGLSLTNWLKSIFYFVPTISIGGAFSYLFKPSRA